MKKKACKTCKMFVEGELCPICKREAFSTNWQGRIQFLDLEKSVIAKEMNVDKEGEYALKVR